MSLKNQVTIVGSLLARPSITTFESGSMVARFSVEISPDQERVDDARKYREVRAFAWGNVAQFVHHYLEKGSRMAVTGKLVNRTYMGQDGRARQITEVEVRRVVKLTD